MATFLFDEIIFGPVKSRRLGVSLGINLLPTGSKLCNFNCIYCECGLTSYNQIVSDTLPDRKDVFKALEMKLSEMKRLNKIPDVITFAGNGEPTLHPEFPEIIDDCLSLRDSYFPGAKIAVLSNSTTITNPPIREALLKVDMNILKLDSAISATISSINQSARAVDAEELIRNLTAFNGRLIIQTLFLRGSFNGISIDNTTHSEVSAWLKALEKIRPAEVMIYTISRDTPEGGSFQKVSLSELRGIADMVESIGIATQVSG